MGLMNAARAGYRLMAPGVHLPIYVMMYVTHRCDARCGHCFFWQELNTGKNDELSAEEIDALAKSIGPTFQVSLTGGSPELRVDLPLLAKSFHDHCKPLNMTLCMNGYHTDRIIKHVTQILSSCPGQRLTVGLSLDGIGAEHDELRGMPGLFERLTNTFGSLAEIRKTNPQLRLAAAIVVSGLNYQTAEDTASWARDNLPIDSLKPILVRGNPKDRSAISEKTRAIYEKIRDGDHHHLSGEYRRGDSFHRLMSTAKERIQREIIAEIHETGLSPVDCSASMENIVIRANGDVMGCELRDEVLGNLRDHAMDVKSLWHGVEAKRFRKTKKKEKCACHHHCFLAPAIFRSPMEWPNVLQVAGTILRDAK